MDDKLIMSIAALRIIAMSYRERIDRADTPPYEYAADILAFLGEDLDLSIANSEQADDRAKELLTEFRKWRKNRDGNNL